MVDHAAVIFGHVLILLISLASRQVLRVLGREALISTQHASIWMTHKSLEAAADSTRILLRYEHMRALQVPLRILHALDGLLEFPRGNEGAHILKANRRVMVYLQILLALLDILVLPSVLQDVLQVSELFLKLFDHLVFLSILFFELASLVFKLILHCANLILQLHPLPLSLFLAFLHLLLYLFLKL